MPTRIPKVEAWDVALARYVASARAVPAIYGLSDCVLFVAGAVAAQTGVNLGAAHWGQYEGEGGAAAYMAAHGWSDVEAVAAAHLPEIALQGAHRGDILSFPGQAGPSLGVHMGLRSVVLSSAGAVQVPTSRATRAWRVG